MAPNNPKRELERLESFRAELKEVVRKNPSQPILGYGTARHALMRVETEIIEMTNALNKNESIKRRRPRLPFN
jgi:hypothetical protein